MCVSYSSSMSYSVSVSISSGLYKYKIGVNNMQLFKETSSWFFGKIVGTRLRCSGPIVTYCFVLQSGIHFDLRYHTPVIYKHVLHTSNSGSNKKKIPFGVFFFPNSIQHLQFFNSVFKVSCEMSIKKTLSKCTYISINLLNIHKVKAIFNIWFNFTTSIYKPYW